MWFLWLMASAKANWCQEFANLDSNQRVTEVLQREFLVSLIYREQSSISGCYLQQSAADVNHP